MRILAILVLAAGISPAFGATQTIDATVQPAIAFATEPAGPSSGAVSVSANAPYEITLEAIVPSGGSATIDHIRIGEMTATEYRAPLLARASTGEGTDAFNYLVLDDAQLVLVYTASTTV